LQEWLHCASSARQVHTVQAVEADHPCEVPRAYEVRLVDCSWSPRNRSWVFLPLRLVATLAASGEFVTRQYAPDRSHLGERIDIQLFQFLSDRL
jgi:hypothetical protein